MSTVASPSPILDAAGVAPDEALSILQTALSGADDGELFLEKTESESLVFDDGRLKGASYDAVEGFGLRVVAGETAGYAHANEISAAAIRRAADSAALAKRGYAETTLADFLPALEEKAPEICSNRQFYVLWLLLHRRGELRLDAESVGEKSVYSGIRQAVPELQSLRVVEIPGELEWQDFRISNMRIEVTLQDGV